MKKQLLLVAIVSIALFVSCEKDEENPILELMTSESIFVTDETSQRYTYFNSSSPWVATTDVSWCKIISANQGNGNSESQYIHIEVEANPTTEERTATISIQAGTLKKNIVLTQTGGTPNLYINTGFMSVDGAENTCSITVTSNSQWTATVNDAAINNWCTITPNSGFGNGTITVSVARNYSYARRHAFISVTNGVTQRTDTIFQVGGETYSDPSIAVTINGLVWATRNVGDFGTFTDFATESGKYYKFNRTIGYSYVGGYLERDGNHDDIVGGTVEPLFDSERTKENSDWILLNDPCPSGWRLPTDEELEDLRSLGYRWVNDPAGAWLGQDAPSATFAVPGNAIFLPAKGLILDDVIHYANQGCYWTKTQGTSYSSRDDGGQALSFNPTGSRQVTSAFMSKSCALLVRCIKE